MPELNDKFAADTTEFETLDELKADIRANLEEQANNMAENQIREELVNKIADAADFITPNAMVEDQLDRMMQDLNYQLMSQGLQMEMLLEITGKDLNGLKEERREDAEKLVRGTLVLDEIAKLENIEASEEDVDAEIAKMAEMYKMEAEEMKKALRPEDLEDIAGQLKVRKTIDFLVENATIA